MNLKKNFLLVNLMILLFFISGVHADDCTDCHEKETPGIVEQWNSGKMSGHFSCSTCHGSAHKTMTDSDNAKMPTFETCKGCHPEKADQYSKGKHAAAWIAQNAMPTTHMQPMALIEGQKGCGGCHKIGLKGAEEVAKLISEGEKYGHVACDSCHTRHSFSKAEALEPEACKTCHMGFDHPQWEMWSNSKHGVRYELNRLGTVPTGAVAPKCQTCHMQEGNHEVRTAWGFLAVRLPMPEDEQWAADRATILTAMGVLDPEGNPTGRLDAVKAADVARLTQEDWQRERDKMLDTCTQCHSESFAKGELEKGDDMIREADRLLAEGIREVVAMYQEGLIEKPEFYSYDYPDLLAFSDAQSTAEQALFKMFLEHRMRAFQGTFHANPDYALWYGWSEMKTDLVEIKDEHESLKKEMEISGELTSVKTQADKFQVELEKVQSGAQDSKGICGPTLLIGIAALPLAFYGILRRKRE